MAKNPAFQFYVYDWQTSRKLRRCTAKARGVWIELMGLMHDGDIYGHLIFDGHVPDTKEVASMTQLGLRELRSGWSELKEKKVLKFTDKGVPYSSRMVRDGKVREQAKINGKKGGNPKLMPEPLTNKITPPLTPEDKQKSTPSSSSSSSVQRAKEATGKKGPKDPKKLTPNQVEKDRQRCRIILGARGYWNRTKTCATRLDDHLLSVAQEAKKKDDPSAYFASVAVKRLEERLEDFKPDRSEMDEVDKLERVKK